MRGKRVRRWSQLLGKLLERLGFPGREHRLDPRFEREGRWHGPMLLPAARSGHPGCDRGHGGL